MLETQQKPGSALAFTALTLDTVKIKSYVHALDRVSSVRLRQWRWYRCKRLDYLRPMESLSPDGGGNPAEGPRPIAHGDVGPRGRDTAIRSGAASGLLVHATNPSDRDWTSRGSGTNQVRHYVYIDISFPLCRGYGAKLISLGFSRFSSFWRALSWERTIPKTAQTVNSSGWEQRRNLRVSLPTVF